MNNDAYVKRDFTWLSFNERVLQEARDKNVPLYERLKFLAIYSSNLDEFFRVRVAALRNLKLLKKSDRKALEIGPKKELSQIKKIVEEHQIEFGRIYKEELKPELEKQGIFLLSDLETEANQEQKAFAKNFFKREIEAHITVWKIGQEDSAPFLENNGIYFLAPRLTTEGMLCINIPSNKIDRFVTLPSEGSPHRIAFIDDIMRLALPNFLKKKTGEFYSVKVSRDAEMYMGNEYDFPDEMLDKIKKALKQRDSGAPTRLLYDQSMPDLFLDQIKSTFGVSEQELVPGGRYHNFKDFFGFPDPSQNVSLHNEGMPPLPHPSFEKADSILQLMDERDVMLHFPYQKYDYVPRLIREAANDSKVKEIKITLYRVASKSGVVQELLRALDLGKNVVAFIEAKARFDEESNLYWGGELEKAGAKVMYSLPGIKVHTKLLLIRRKEKNGIRNYSYLGTGNFNEKTARLYCDHALLTGDEKLGKEVTQIFDLLERKIILPRTRHLFVSPFSSRIGFVELIDKEIRNARAGKSAYMILKMNSLEDPGLIEKLYEASQEGVDIKLIVRGICCLVPGVTGTSENIKVISIVDRFLEHARVYIFANDGEELMYIASADWMTRNLDRRVEVVIPIYDEHVYQELRHIIDLQLADNCKARVIDIEQRNSYRRNGSEQSSLRSQVAIYEYLKENAS